MGEVRWRIKAIEKRTYNDFKIEAGFHGIKIPDLPSDVGTDVGLSEIDGNKLDQYTKAAQLRKQEEMNVRQ